MIRIITLTALLFLAACKTVEEQRTIIEHNLPDGCTMTEVGEYKSIDLIVVIQCDGRATVTTMGTSSAPKQPNHDFVAVMIGGGA